MFSDLYLLKSEKEEIERIDDALIQHLKSTKNEAEENERKWLDEHIKLHGEIFTATYIPDKPRFFTVQSTNKYAQSLGRSAKLIDATELVFSNIAATERAKRTFELSLRPSAKKENTIKK
ncbi:uncharacterized protein MONOS_17769 [Monocercomonoides exilis]|uniref:uncharacterized protein n=1 Tax=Monocercomonoides exilis TaxID=2049356 RepID=UPI00355A07B9|nr:hypothetical protein MONOS_17769 [Monocercomonoides exilis]